MITNKMPASESAGIVVFNLSSTVTYLINKSSRVWTKSTAWSRQKYTPLHNAEPSDFSS